MPKKNRKTENIKSERLEIRIHPRLKQALDDYCAKHLEKLTEAVTNAIKKYVGFEKKTDLE
jgi:hypothetical protein